MKFKSETIIKLVSVKDQVYNQVWHRVENQVRGQVQGRVWTQTEEQL